MATNLTTQNLAQFSGSECLYVSLLMPLKYTEGVKFLIDNGASRVVQLVAMVSTLFKEHDRQFWKLVKSDIVGADLVLEDGDGKEINRVHEESLIFCDSLLEGLEGGLSIWVMDGVMLLPGEY